MMADEVTTEKCTETLKKKKSKKRRGPPKNMSITEADLTKRKKYDMNSHENGIETDGNSANVDTTTKVVPAVLEPVVPLKPRPSGVFPHGIQPHRIIVVLDDLSPCIDAAKLRAAGQEVITGSNLDVFGFLELIQGHESYAGDGILYVVLPWIDFFLKHLPALESDDHAIEYSDGENALLGIGQTCIPLIFKRVVFNFSPKIQPNDVQSLIEIADGLTYVPVKSCMTQILVKRIITAGLRLRSGIITNKLNCEVVFGGIPLSCLTKGHPDAQHCAEWLEKSKLFSASVLTAARTFNEFAANTWKLGGFDGPNYNPPVESSDNSDIPCSVNNTNAGNNTNADNTMDVHEEETEQAEESCELDESSESNEASKASEASKETKPKPEVIRATKETCTEVILESVRKVTDLYRIKGVFLPWLPIECEEFDARTEPYAVTQSLAGGIYEITEEVEEEEKEKEPHSIASLITAGGNFCPRTVCISSQWYRCVVCSMVLRGSGEAEQHAVTEQHNKAVLQHLKKTKEGDPQLAEHIASLVYSTDIGLTPEYMDRLVTGGIVLTESLPPQQESLPPQQRYTCVVCEPDAELLSEAYLGAQQLTSPQMRAHLHSAAHQRNLLSHLGLFEQLPATHSDTKLFANWPHIKTMLRYPSRDVVLLADEVHRMHLLPLTRLHPRIHLYTVPELFREPAGRRAALKRWQERDGGGGVALWLVVSGVDLLMCRGQNKKTNKKTTKKPTADEDQMGAEDAESKEAQAEKKNQELVFSWERVGVRVLVELHAFLRDNLPASSSVVVVPLMPQHVMRDSSECDDRRKDAFHASQDIPAPASQPAPPNSVQCFSVDSATKLRLSRRLYIEFANQCYTVHLATATHENIIIMENHTHVDIAVKKGSVSRCVTTSWWYVSVEDMVASAIFGMPSVFPNQHAKDHPMKRDCITDMIMQPVIMGDISQLPLRKHCAYLSYKRIVVVPQTVVKLNDTTKEVFLKEIKEKSTLLMCYLTCPFPASLLNEKKADFCIEGNCSKHISSWNYRCLDFESTALLNLKCFITKLQMGGNTTAFFTLFPIMPCYIITYDAEDENCHKEMHDLQQCFPNVYFSNDTDIKRLRSSVDNFRAGYLEIFKKIKLGHSNIFPENSFNNIVTCELQDAMDLLKKEFRPAMLRWTEAVTTLFRECFYNTYNDQFTKAMEEFIDHWEKRLPLDEIPTKKFVKKTPTPSRKPKGNFSGLTPVQMRSFYFPGNENDCLANRLQCASITGLEGPFLPGQAANWNNMGRNHFGGSQGSFGGPGNELNRTEMGGYGGQTGYGGQQRGYDGPDRQFGGADRQYGGPNSQYGGQNSQYGGQNSQYGGPNSQYGGQNSQYGGQNSQYGGQNSQYGGQNSQYGGQNSQYGGQNNQYGGQNNQYGGTNRQYDGPDRQFGGMEMQFDESDYCNDFNNYPQGQQQQWASEPAPEPKVMEPSNQRPRGTDKCYGSWNQS